MMEAALAKRLVEGLKESGIDLVTYLPETRLSQILPLLRSDPSFTLVPVASESEAVTIGAGAALTGKQVAIYMECTGLYVSCYTLVSIARRYGVPLLLLVAYLGSMNDQRNNSVYAVSGTYVEPLLDALQIKTQILVNGERLEADIQDAVRHMHALKLPVALVFTGDFTR
jgi:sulfopyruvate decarboxylase TPP-binding subunit